MTVSFANCQLPAVVSAELLDTSNMNESVDLLPFAGGPMVGRKRRALAALCLLARSGAALVLGATLILEPKTVGSWARCGVGMVLSVTN